VARGLLSLAAMRTLLVVVLAAGLCACSTSDASRSRTGEGGGDVKLLNVSYDPTRELYEEFNAAFAKHWQKQKGQRVTIDQSHGGSSKQARAVIDGLQADVVTLAMAADVDAISRQGRLLPATWQTKLPRNSAPYTSTMVFVVRRGNPKNIRDWDDVVRPGVVVIPGNPKTSGAARWVYLAAYAYAREHHGGDEGARAFVAKLYQNAPVLDSGARGTTTTFAERGIGDVMLNWENDAILLKKQRGADFEIVYPSMSIRAEPSVAVVEENARRRGTTEVARAYLEYLFSDEGQEIAARHHYRPTTEAILRRHAEEFPALRLVTVQDAFGGWTRAQETHFADGGVFDRIYEPAR
jgi:sulfate transport system substrate-binding protein